MAFDLGEIQEMSDETRGATARPWKVVPGYDRSSIVGGQGEGGHAHVIAEVRHPNGLRAAQGPANAALIVRTANEYDAHRALEDAARDLVSVVGSSDPFPEGSIESAVVGALRAALSAIAATRTQEPDTDE